MEYGVFGTGIMIKRLQSVTDRAFINTYFLFCKLLLLIYSIICIFKAVPTKCTALRKYAHKILISLNRINIYWIPTMANLWKSLNLHTTVCPTRYLADAGLVFIILSTSRRFRNHRRAFRQEILSDIKEICMTFRIVMVTTLHSHTFACRQATITHKQ